MNEIWWYYFYISHYFTSCFIYFNVYIDIENDSIYSILGLVIEYLIIRGTVAAKFKLILENLIILVLLIIIKKVYFRYLLFLFT